MKRSASLIIVCLFAALGGWLWVSSQSEDTLSLDPNDATLVALGLSVYQEHCAACHGANLEGEPNWRQRNSDGLLPAPPHDPSGHTWHHPDKFLFTLTKYGVASMIGDPDYATAMPVYEGTLSDRDILAVLSYIKSTWPADIQQRHDLINAQAATN